MFWGSLGFACKDIATVDDGTETRYPITCQSDDECEPGSCSRELALCVSHDIGYEQLLLEIVPQSTDSRAGGLRLFHELTDISGAAAVPAPLDVTVPPLLTGSVRLSDAAGGSCEPIEVQLTLIPRESLKGIPATRYSTVSVRGFPRDGGIDAVNEFRFDRVPRGVYDLYWEDAGLVKNIPPECEVVPQLFRGQLIDRKLDLALVQPPPDAVTLEIPWPDDQQDDLHGWTVDVVHPVTGQRISTQRKLSREAVEETERGDRVVIAHLRVANVVADYGTPGQELLRLRPPPGLNRPTIYFVLFPLVTVEGGAAQVPGPVETFASQRRVEAWVWEKESVDGESTNGLGGYDNPVPVAGRVEFVARQLADEPDSFFRVRFSRTVEIEESGKIELELPPGTYTARVRPDDERLSVYETSVTVWTRARGESEAQAGRIIEVPTGAPVNGRVAFPDGLVPTGSQVQLLPAPTGSSATLGDSAAVPRTLTTLTRSGGRFSFPQVDCNRCDDERGFDYLLRVIPPMGTELPWLLKAPFSVGGRTTDESLRMTFPGLHFGQIVLTRTTGTFSSALVRAHLPLDAEGRALPVGTMSCLERTASMNPGTPCVQRTVVVAETRTDSDGVFQLLLPTWNSPDD